MTLLRTVALLTAADEIGVVASVLSNGDWTEPTGYPWGVIQYIGLGPVKARLAERVGFEPTVGANPRRFFKTAALNHSATSPHTPARGQRRLSSPRAE